MTHAWAHGKSWGIIWPWGKDKVFWALGSPFLVAGTQFYKRLCPSVGPSVMVNELKSGKTSVFNTLCVCLSVAGGLGCGWGLDVPAHLSATIL